MGRIPRSVVLAVAAAFLAGTSALATVPAGAQAASRTTRSAAASPRSAAQEAGLGATPAGCASTGSTPATPSRPTAHCYLSVQRGEAAPPQPSTSCPVDAATGYTACNIQNAYGLTSLSLKRGKGSTVAVVDAYDDPNAEADLGFYRSSYGLPPCTTANGCFKKVNQEGVQGSYPTPDAGWAQEISLDLDMVSAVCPNCHILLVEANSSGFGDLGSADNEAVALGAKAVSNSWGTGEFHGETGYDGYFDHPGVAMTFSSGDGAYQGGVQYPSASPYVTSVGGTELTPASNTRGWTEATWVTIPASGPPVQGSGSGCSAYEPKPPWQKDTACPNRMTADVSAVAADVNSYDTYNASGWYYSFGTSVSSPLVAGLYGLAKNPTNYSIPAAAAYTAAASALHDITSGSTGTCTPPSTHKYWCHAVKGYDGPTGVGSPHSIGAFTVPAGTAPSISTVTFSGPPSSPTVTITGSGFGTYPPFAVAAGCGTTGSEYGPTGLWLTDTTAAWTAGQDGDCIGLFVSSWTATSVSYTFGSGYTSYGTLANTDGYTAEILGVQVSGTVTGLS